MPEYDFAGALGRSLVDRAKSLGSYVLSLQASYNRTEDTYNAALDLFYLYTEAVVDQVERDLDTAKSRRAQIMDSRLADFYVKQSLFDQRFARGAQSNVPRALHTLVRRELRALGLDDVDAVLTVGPPDSFETHRSDLRSFLFRNLPFAPNPNDARSLALISVPYVEGTRALWFPIGLGHEVAHVRIERFRADAPPPDFGGDIDEADSDLAALLDAEDDSHDGRGGLGRVEEMRGSLRSWTEELVCDCNAIRAYGPAGLSSIAEFLSTQRSASIASPPWRLRRSIDTHPPLAVRVDVMSKFLDHIGFSKRMDFVQSWRSIAEQSSAKGGAVAEYLASVVQDRADAIFDHVLHWGDLGYVPGGYDVSARIATLLQEGIPGSTHVQRQSGQITRVSVPDVVNASWITREGLEALSPDAESFSRMGGSHSARVTIDRLASKAIDDLEFCQLWEVAGRSVEYVAPPDKAGEVDTPEPSGGLLSRRVIESRMRSDVLEERLTVTPLLEGALQDAGIDLRLGADFIVFKHSATSVFDSVHLDDRLGHSQDPRRVQEHVGKSWGEPFILHAGELVLASTLEYVVLPDDVAAQVVTRSSYGRLGLITATAVQVQPGSRNCITLELVNHGATPIALMPGTRIAQLVLMHVPHSSSPKRGKYWHPTGPEFSKVREDRDSEALRALARISRWREGEGRSVKSGVAVAVSFVGDFVSAYGVYCLCDALRTRARMNRDGLVYRVNVNLNRADVLTGLDLFCRFLPSGVDLKNDDGVLQVKVNPAVRKGSVAVVDETGSTHQYDILVDEAGLARRLQSLLAARGGRWEEPLT